MEAEEVEFVLNKLQWFTPQAVYELSTRASSQGLITEASQRPTARFVPVKTLEQQDIQSLDRIRDRLMKHRTATTNQLRGLLSEYGIISKVGVKNLSKEILLILEDASNRLTVIARDFMRTLYLEIIEMNKKY